MNTIELAAKNFKFLCKYYGDTQPKLKDLLYVPQSNISAYWNGKKPIPSEILQKIAIRYNVTVDELINVDLALKYDEPQTITVESSMNFGSKIFPMLNSNIANKNTYFNAAYDKYNRVMQVESTDELIKRFGLLELAISQFQKAWETSHTYVALTNCISCILFMYASLNTDALKVSELLLIKGELNPQDIKKANLRDPRKKVVRKPYELRQKEFFEKYESIVYEYISILKKEKQFADIGDYYLALCYLCNFSEEEISFQESYTTSQYILLQLAKIDNKYAIEFFENFPGIS